MKDSKSKKYIYVAKPTPAEPKSKELMNLVEHEARRLGVLKRIKARGGIVLRFGEVLGFSDFRKHIQDSASWDTHLSIMPMRRGLKCRDYS